LDIGTRNLNNVRLFWQGTRGNATGISLRSDLARSREVDVVGGDARGLPFRDESLGHVTMSSLMESVIEPFVCPSETLKVLRSDGELHVQFLNPAFLVESHSGLLMYFYLPVRARDGLAEIAGCTRVKEIEILLLPKIRTILRRLGRIREIVTATFSCSEPLLPGSAQMRVWHRILRFLGIFLILPIGYVETVRERELWYLGWTGVAVHL